MGSPVSAVIANLYMESFEEQAITTSSYGPRIWKRYMNEVKFINCDPYYYKHRVKEAIHIRLTLTTSTGIVE